MPAGGGLAMRSVWISLRALNYTDQAFRDTIKNFDKLSTAQKEDYKNLTKSKDAAMKGIQVGMLYGAMTLMVAQRLGQLISTTQLGSQFMAGFNQTFSELKVGIADALFSALKPFLEMLKSFMDIVKDSGPLKALVAIVVIAGVAFLALYSAYKVVTSIIAMNNAIIALNTFLHNHNMITVNAHTGAVQILGLSYKQLAISIGVAFAGFLIFYSLLSGLNGPIKIAAAAIMILVGAILALVTAKSWLKGTFGLEGIAGLAGVGAVVAGSATLAQSTMPSYKIGTPYVPKSGPAMIHEGEGILTKEENRVRREGKTGTTQSIKIDMSGMILQTKMNKEEFVPFLKRELRNIVTSKEY
jgi:hypothetical protein